MQAWSSSNMLKHGKQVLLVHHPSCRNHIYSSSEGDINLPHLWHRSHRKAFFGDRLCSLQLLLSLGPEVCRLKAFLNFLMVLSTRCWLGNSQEEPDNNTCTLTKHKPKETQRLTGPDAFYDHLPPSHLRPGFLSKPSRYSQGDKTQIQKGTEV